MNKEIKVLQLVTSMEAGGIERWLLGIMPYMRDHNVRIDFLCRKPSPVETIKLLRQYKSQVWVNERYGLYGYTKLLRQILKENKYDLVNNHLSIHCGLPAIVTRKMQVGSVVSFHNSHFAPMKTGNPVRKGLSKIYGKWSVKKGIKNSSVITAGSKDISSGIAMLAGINEQEFNIIHYGVDIPEIAKREQRHAFRSSLGVDKDTKVVLHIGRFSDQKNHIGFVEIARKTLQKLSNVIFVLIGDGPNFELIKQLVSSYAMADSFRFLGRQYEINNFYRYSDIFLFPSLWEGLPVAAIEAAASGLPIVGSNVPGIKIVVEDKKTGMLFPPNNHNIFANAVVKLCKDEALCAQMSKMARERAGNLFSRTKSAHKLYHLYKNIRDIS